MKTSGYFKRFFNIRRPVFLRTAKPFFFLLAFLLMTTSNVLPSAQPKNATEIQVYNDMMYGTDDYFGQNSDLSYVDGVVPSANQPAKQPVATTQQSTTTSSSSSGTSVQTTQPTQATTSSSDSGSSSGGGAGSEPPTDDSGGTGGP